MHGVVVCGAVQWGCGMVRCGAVRRRPVLRISNYCTVQCGASLPYGTMQWVPACDGAGADGAAWPSYVTADGEGGGVGDGAGSVGGLAGVVTGVGCHQVWDHQAAGILVHGVQLDAEASQEARVVARGQDAAILQPAEGERKVAPFQCTVGLHSNPRRHVLPEEKGSNLGWHWKKK